MAEQKVSTLAQILAEAGPQLPLAIFSVSDRGVPNRERVNLRVNFRTYLGDYFLHAGIFLPNGRAIPLPNTSLWLGEDTIDADAWVMIYTGPGEAKLMTQTRDTKKPTIVLHWNFERTIFHTESIVPVLIKIDTTAVQIGQPDSP